MADIPLRDRRIRVVVDTIEITGLRITFKVSKSLKPEPNTAELRIWNLNETHQSALEQLQTAKVLIEAGYKAGTSVLFLGDLRTAKSVTEGPDTVTALSSGDGEKAVKKARVNVSLGKTTTPDQVLRAIAEAMGVDKGNLDQAVSNLKSSGISNHFTEGTVISGSAYREMTAVCRSVGLSWSIQDGKLQCLPLRTSLDGTAVKLSKDTGLIGSPTVDNDGVMSCRMLLIPDIIPGRKLVLEAERLKGQYRVEACAYSGDTHGGDWYIDAQAKRY